MSYSKTLLAFILVFSQTALAGSSVYCGSIQGTQSKPIMMQISGNTAQYFFRDDKKLVPLKVVSQTPQSLKLSQGTKGGASFALMANGNAYTGYWTSGKNKFGVTLNQVSNPNSDFSFYQKGQPRVYLNFGSTTIILTAQPINNFYYNYTVTQYKDPTQAAALTAWLNKTMTAAEGFVDDCSDIFLTSQMNAYLINDQLFYADARVSGMFPGAAHPVSNEGQFVYFDLANKITLNTKNVFTNFASDKAKIIPIVFAKKIAAAASQANPSTSGNTCWQSYTLAQLLSPNSLGFEIGINMQTGNFGLAQSFAHFANACNYDFQYVGAAQLLPFMNKNTSLYTYLAPAPATAKNNTR